MSRNTINFKSTREEVVKAMLDFRRGNIKIANAQADFREEKAALDEWKADTLKEIDQKWTSAKTTDEKNAFAAQKNEILATYDNRFASISEYRAVKIKEGRQLTKAAYSLLIPCDDEDKLYTKKSEEYKALYNAYVFYQETLKFDKFSDLFSQFLTSIGYEDIANKSTYKNKTAKIFAVKLGSVSARNKDLLNGVTITTMTPTAFNKLFLNIFYSILLENGVFAEYRNRQAEKKNKEKSGKPSAKATPWDILGVKPGCSVDELKRAFYEAVKKFHPDNGGSAEDFRKVMEAYNTLKAE